VSDSLSFLFIFRLDPKLSCWYKYLSPGPWSDKTSKEGKEFRRRFRLTWDMFMNMLDKHVQAGDLGLERPDAVGREAMPLGLKILGVLRVLGRGVCFDDVAELTNATTQEVHRVFFHKFIRVYAEEYFKDWVKMPKTEDEIKSSMKEYTEAGMAGCIGELL